MTARMPENETTRLIAWSSELREAHTRLRKALAFVRAGGADPQSADRDLPDVRRRQRRADE